MKKRLDRCSRLGGAREDRLCSVSSLLFVVFTVSSSPYINRFLSADTIVPGYANPQNLNRYSYVTNNPLRYTDPTGHMRVDDEGGGGNKGCSDPKYCNNGKPKSKDELDKMLIIILIGE